MTPIFSDKSTSAIRFDRVCATCKDVIAQLAKNRKLEFPIRLDWLTETVSARLATATGNFPIELLAKDWGAEQFTGFLSRYHDHAKIIYSYVPGPNPKTNTCWRRYVITKELAHLVLDTTDSFTTDPVGLVEGLINDLPNIRNRADLLSEQVSPLAAIELLLPWSLRHQVYEMAKTMSHRKIAESCRVPEKIVSTVLSSEYRAFSEFANMAH